MADLNIMKPAGIEWTDRAIIRSAVNAPDLSLKIIRHVTYTHVFSMTDYREHHVLVPTVITLTPQIYILSKPEYSGTWLDEFGNVLNGRYIPFSEEPSPSFLPNSHQRCV